MRVLPTNRSIHYFWEELTFTEAALKADEETAELAAPVTAVLDDFAAISKVDLDTRRGIIQAYARSAVADNKLDDAIRDVHANTLHLVRQDRSRKEYQALFSDTIYDVVRHALAKQITIARKMLDTLKLSLFTPEFRDGQHAVLQGRIGKGEAVLDERKQAELTRAEARLTIEGWKDEVNAIRSYVYAELIKIAASNKRKRAWAESFFPRTSSRKTREDEPEVEVEAEPEPEIEAEA